MTGERISILAAARRDGYREGLGQAGQISYDEAYDRGQHDAWDDAPSRLRWFLFGAATAGIAALCWGLS